MAGKVWFGTRNSMRWIPAPQVDMDIGRTGYSSGAVQRLSGSAGIRNSKGGAKRIALSWNLQKLANVRPILDYAAGIHDAVDGKNLIYFIDPITLGTDGNVLGEFWAFPAQARSDGLTHILGQSPVSSPTLANTLDYPARSVTYTANASSQSVWVPIPPGKVAWFGAHGSATGAAGMTVTPTNGFTALAPTTPAMLPVTSTTRVNASYSSANCDGILIALTNLGAASTATVTLAGLMVQLLPIGVIPVEGGYISGQGNSGFEFDGKPAVTEHSAAMDLVGVSAKLVETGWGL